MPADAAPLNDSRGPLAGRRRFLRRSCAAAAGTVLGAWGGRRRQGETAASAASLRQSPVEQLLRRAVLRRETVDRFLDPRARVWASFDPLLGYGLRNAFLRDGVDGCYTLARYEQTGQRRQVNFREDPCRINTYGDSFTQGHQVSDGETWQEVLAAHFCEPLRNFGVGGYGVYQAYRRLLQIEATELAAPFVIFNIWGDDQLRSVNAWRWLTFPPDVLESMSDEMFHANPWSHARLDAEGRLQELPNPCPTPASLYQLCDVDFVIEAFGNDPIVHLLAAIESGAVVNADLLEETASVAGFGQLRWTSPQEVRETARALYHHYALQTGKQILARLQEFCGAQGKRLFVLLSHPAGSVWHRCAGSPQDDPAFIDWHPQELRDFLTQRGIPFLDTVEKHYADFQHFRGDAKAYVDRYYIGHYNPQGNHFFAFAVKDALREWLDPEPPAYRGGAETLIRFEGYLPG